MAIDRKKIKNLDSNNVYQSISYLPEQVEQVIDDVRKLKFPNTFRNSDLIAISGMGGSIYNYSVILSLFDDQLDRPIVLVNGYKMPKRILKDTLFIGSSYSGDTEETLLTTQEAIKNDDAVTAITGGGKLAQLMKRHKLPFYEFKPRFNPSNQPRIGLGYMVFGPIMILNNLGYLQIQVAKLKKSLQKLRDLDEKIQNDAYSLVSKIRDKMIILIGAEHLQGNIHIARNQFNETAKTYAEYHLIPELNHHLIEGLTYPKNKHMVFLFYNSSFFYKRNQERLAITNQVLKKQLFDCIDIKVDAVDKLEEFLLIMQFNSYLSFFLGIEYGVDPSKIPWVDYFKKQLS